MLKRFRDILLLFGVVLVVSGYLLFSSVVSDEDGVIYYVRPGTSVRVMINEMAEQEVIKYSWFLSLYSHFYWNTTLKTGEYLFPKGSSLFSIWRQVTTGKGHYYRAFTIVPGWSFPQLLKQLLLTPTLKHSTQNMNNKQIMQAIGAENVEPEGEFFPETYNYTRDVPDLVILQRAYDLMQMHLKEAWSTRAPDLPYKDAYQALIAASLVEKEAYLNSERPIIAGVLVNRLKANMLLQFDPTVIYGMGDSYYGQIHHQDLLTDTPYNTYIHKGLPPTPIAMPSEASIQAAMHPTQHSYYYFVANGGGGHQFSKTLPEHNIAVDAYKKGKQNVAR